MTNISVAKYQQSDVLQRNSNHFLTDAAFTTNAASDPDTYTDYVSCDHADSHMI